MTYLIELTGMQQINQCLFQIVYPGWNIIYFRGEGGLYGIWYTIGVNNY